MALKSMTGFARSDGREGDLSWHWEIRSVNAKGLDIRLRMPPGFEGLEQQLRETCKTRFGRGNFFIALSVSRELAGTEIRLNERGLRDIAGVVQQAGGLVDAAPPTLDGLLSIRGVLEYGEANDDEEKKAAETAAVLEDFENALGEIAEARGAEGERLSRVMAADLDEVERLVGEIDAAPARTPEAIRSRLAEQVARLLESSDGLDENRLHQEAVLIATRADVQEEIERLRAHVSAARDLLDEDKPVGRRFDFLMQEFNREANTICSKSNDTEISRAGLSLKTTIDRLREQVQNIE